MLVNTTWRKGSDRVTILDNGSLNHNGNVYTFEVEGTQYITHLKWECMSVIVEKGRFSGWEEELPLFNPYHFQEWQKFLFMFFRNQYMGPPIECGELDTDLWREWKEHYLNENQCGLKSPRDRSSLRLKRSPFVSPISSPTISPRGTPQARRSYTDLRRSPLPHAKVHSDQPLRLRSSPGRCQTPRGSPEESEEEESE